jgi:hypothetical protein
MDTAKPNPPTVEITISSNQPHSGKTAIAVIIGKALLEHGFDDLLVYNMDGDFPKLCNRDTPVAAADLIVAPCVRIDDTNGHGKGRHTPTFRIGPNKPKE